MKIFNTIVETRELLLHYRNDGKSIGFVPTMGALHQGHISLLQQANIDNDIVVCSIFVNPIQFNKKDDLDNYPRTIVEDTRKLEEVECDVLFYPSADEMYPNPVLDKFDFGHLDKVMEGAHRPGHFNGVAVVVKKLFEILMPHLAYFGMKDYQQLRIIETMVDKLGMDVQIIPCPTMREKDGLAMSSRNVRLTVEERAIAPAISRILVELKAKKDTMSPGEAEAWGIRQLNKYQGMRVEYLSLVDAHDLLPVNDWNDKKSVVACTAVNLGKVRLIDNLILF